MMEILLGVGFFVLWLRRNIQQARRQAAIEGNSRVLSWLAAFSGDLPGLIFLFSALAVLAPPGLVQGEIVVAGNELSAATMGWLGLFFSVGLVTWAVGVAREESWRLARELAVQNFRDAAWLFLAVSFLAGIFRIPASF